MLVKWFVIFRHSSLYITYILTYFPIVIDASTGVCAIKSASLDNSDIIFLTKEQQFIPISHRTNTIILAGIQSSCSTPTMVQWILLHWSPRKKVQFLTEKRAHHFAVKRVNTERIVRSWAFRLPRQRFDVARQRRVFVQLMHMILHIMTNSYTPDNIEWNVHYITMICLALVASK